MLSRGSSGGCLSIPLELGPDATGRVPAGTSLPRSDIRPPCGNNMCTKPKTTCSINWLPLMFEHTNMRCPQAIRCMLLSCESCKPTEKSTCLAMTVRAIACLAGPRETMAHCRSKAVVRPPSPCILVVEIGRWYLFVPTEGMLGHETLPPLGHRRWAPPVLLLLPQWQSDQEAWLANTK